VSYRLSLDQPVPDAVRAVAYERANHALQALHETASDDPATAVHDVRKDAKKLRALLRLLQPALDPKLRRGENRAIASIARSLSGSRDAAVLAKQAGDLREHAVGQAPESTFSAVHEALAQAASGGDTELGQAIPGAVADLEALVDRIGAWPLDNLRARTLVAGLERTDARGRDELGRVRRAPADAAQLHEWRKRVKDIWYQQRLLRDAWPRVLKAQAAELDTLGELLGDDHDLAVLREQLTAPGGVGAGLAVDLEPVLAAIDARRTHLQRRALKIGTRVYAEKPSAFARRHRAYLRAARSGSTIAPA
jgi:CHAD domain-containing protein